MKVKHFVVLGLMAFFVSACAINRGTINSYVEPTYESGSIKRIAVFSIRNARLAPSEARQINRDLIQGLVAKNPDVEVVSPSESLRKINDSDLAGKWADFVEDYYTSGIANKNILGEVAKVLGVDAVMQGQLLNVYQVDGNNWNQKGQTRVTISFSIVETASAKTVWEASADGIKGNAAEYAPAPPIADALDLAMAKVIENMPSL
jgi:hypothetical protein